MSMVPACFGVVIWPWQAQRILQPTVQTMGLGIAPTRIRACIIGKRTRDDARRTRFTEGPDLCLALRSARRTNRSRIATPNQGNLARDAWLADSGCRADRRRFAHPSNTPIISVM